MIASLLTAAVIAVLIGWTLLGWVVALAMALHSERPGPPPAVLRWLFGAHETAR